MYKKSLLFGLVLLIASHSLFVPNVYASSVTFSYTGAQQTWVVPSGVTSITVDAAGAGATSVGTAGSPGLGGRVQTIITTTPGETLYLYVGGTSSANTGGYNGGGNAGASGAIGGGGASDIRQGGTALANRVVVAGGGGGGGEDTAAPANGGNGGNGGNTTGVTGNSGQNGGGGGGGGGTPSAGGNGGNRGITKIYTGNAGIAGSLGIGGNGGGSGVSEGDGGGAGGGYYGGGGGGGGSSDSSIASRGSGGGGGGGSSYSSGTTTTHTQGYQSGNGQIVIVYNNTTPTPSLDSPIDGATNQSLTPIFKTTATDVDGDNLKYKIQICTDSGMTANCQVFDQTSSQTGWSGQNAQTSTAYTSGTQATYTVQSALATSTTYYWRSYAFDNQIYNSTWGSTQTPRSFTTGSNSCNISTFSYTGAQQTWVVPAGITSIYADLYGARGGGSTGGQGGRTQTTLTTTPAETLYLYIGGTGGSSNGGFNGGAGNGYRGGGASDIRQGGTAAANRVAVAGGGGGQGTNGDSYNGGVGGGGGTTSGANGVDGALNGGKFGTGGTSSAGGTGASVRAGAYSTRLGGGGGGGYYGGGGGSGSGVGGNGSLSTGGVGGSGSGTAYGGGGGGGGSSYSSGTNTTHSQGVNSGNGQITITAGTCTPPNTPSLDLPANASLYHELYVYFKTTSSDTEGNDVKYKIELCSDSACNTVIQTFDQTSSQTGWSGQNAQTSTAYKSGTQAIYTVQSALSYNTTYYWRSYAIDLVGTTNTYSWSATQATPYSFTTKPGGCGEPVSGNHSISSACAFTGTINGVDAGSGDTNTAVLTVATGGSLTVLSDQTAAVGSLSLTGGAITIVDGGSIKIGTPIFLPDADGDGYPTAITSTQYLASGANRVRRNLSLDYNDTPGSGATIYPGTVCGGVCSINSNDGTCIANSAGEQGLATCTRCNGSSLTAVNIANLTADTEGVNVTAAHYVCNGSGGSSAPTSNSCYSKTGYTICGDKCTAISATACVSSWGTSPCASGPNTSSCTNTSGGYLYCLCTVYTY